MKKSILQGVTFLNTGLALFMGIGMLTSCTKTKSDLADTKAWYANYEVKNKGATYSCTASFQVGNGNTTTYIELTKGDHVTCNGVAMGRADSVAGQVIYMANVIESSSFNIKLHREGESDYSSLVELPPVVQISQPTAGQILDKQNSFSVRWQPSSTETDRVNASLFFAETSLNPNEAATKYRTYSQAKESGVLTIDGDDTPGSSRAAPTNDDIQAEIKLIRVRKGIMADGLDGRILSSRESSVKVTFR